MTNTGDMTDEAIFDFTGLSGTATRTLTYRGMPIDGPFLYQKAGVRSMKQQVNFTT